MTTFRQEIISRIAVRDPQELADLASRWWCAIAEELTPLIGVDGFFVMYQRSISLTRVRYPWIASQKGDLTFASLKLSLATRDPDDALEASVELLVQFTNILDTLVGEVITSGIISAAWRRDAPESGKETAS